MSAAKHFDALAFVKRSKELGVKEELAEYQARQFDQVIEIASMITQTELNIRALATKTDIKQLEVDIKQLEVDLKLDIKQLEVKLERYRYDSLKFTIWTGIGVVVVLGGMLVKGFHWLS